MCKQYEENDNPQLTSPELITQTLINYDFNSDILCSKMKRAQIYIPSLTITPKYNQTLHKIKGLDRLYRAPSLNSNTFH